MRFETASRCSGLAVTATGPEPWLAYSRGLAHFILLFHSGSRVDRVRNELSARALTGWGKAHLTPSGLTLTGRR
jgi:hypothetical protein